ncbi:DNA/RNA non-specific endonuclease [Heyndrickxia oleronia]|uniref:DNA/RNA non-specific endonuclease n=1 Tax=Heyndrickxia oleronia TaxID=38875 RepID=A0AAW6SXR8_9BACI|nr:DNA/RNA non-specific endonuclease [Heyndrickxia oleronia]MDH5161727.1 DNA/RNA non-specific endonuclease [Heyndrickxia oleronia]
MKKKISYLILLLAAIFIVGCTNVEDVLNTNGKADSQEVTTKNSEKEKTTTEKQVGEETSTQSKDQLFKGYKLIEVDGGNLSGHREPNVVVDIGFGDREYWSFTNEHGQVVRVIANKIVLQDDRTEPVTSSGRYYSDEAKVPGVERADLDEGHIIADSLGGVSNAYNITPQDSTLNRHGDQAYMEDAIRKAGGATNFEAIITYPNTETQIPSHYKYTYTLKGNKIVDEFDNGNPDEINKSLGLTERKSTNSNKSTSSKKSNAVNGTQDISSVDTDGNGQVTIKEAKAAGYSMPITSDHWLYPYMHDNDNDGMVGE